MRKILVLGAIIAFFYFGYFIVFAASSGPNYSGTSVNDTSSTGTVPWLNPGNASGTDNGTLAIADLSSDNWHSDYLWMTNFGFSIPAGATIDGIVAEVKRQNTGGDTFDFVVKLIKSGAVTGNSKATTTAWTTTLQWVSYGASNDLWGSSFTISEINATNFGIAFAAKDPDCACTSARVDASRITVYYTAGAIQQSQTRFIRGTGISRRR